MSRHITSTRVALAAIILSALTILLSGKWLDTRSQIQTVTSTIDAIGGDIIIINEVDSDTPGTDLAEFIELYDGGVGNTPLDGYVIVFYNGTNDQSYSTFDLDGFATSSGGYFTLGNSAVPGVDLVLANGGLQNGPDAVALYAANAADFPNGTPVTITNIRDALVYSNSATIDPGLLVLLNAGQAQINENGAGSGTTASMQRLPNGSGGERNTGTYTLLAPTPDGPNLGPTAASLSLSGRVTDAFGQGIRGARILMEGRETPRSAISSSFGYYCFDGLSVGTYTVTVSSKRHTFATPSRVVTVSDNITEFDYVAEPEE